MAKKIIGIRLSDETIRFLNEESLRNGIHHKLSKEIPNITGTIEMIIEKYRNNVTIEERCNHE